MHQEEKFNADDLDEVQEFIFNRYEQIIIVKVKSRTMGHGSFVALRPEYVIEWLRGLVKDGTLTN